MYEKIFSWAAAPQPISEAEITQNFFADVVVVGAGHAGTCAARAAAEEGVSVFVIEQQPEDRQRILGIGEIGHINSQWQKEQGIPEVDVQTFVNDWQLRTNNRSNYRLIRHYAENCGDCFDWLISLLSEEDQKTIRPMMWPASGNFPPLLNGIRAWPGTAHMPIEVQNRMIRASQQRAKELGARFFFGQKACRLEKREERVCAVVAESGKGGYVRFRANKAVILAAGDYSKNPHMCRDLLTEAADLIEPGTDWSGHGWDGSGIQMGVWAGGRLEPRSHAAMGGNYSFPGFDVVGSTAVLRVNCHGARYSDEGFGTHVLAAIPGARQPNGMLWGVFDSNIRVQLTAQAPCHAVFDYADPTRWERFEQAISNAENHRGQRVYNKDLAGDRRPCYCADTIEELAVCLFEKEEERVRFLSEVARYNLLCHQGIDTDFGKEPHLLFPVERPPFYACGQEKSSHHPAGQSMKLLVTAGGLLVDENQQVLDKEFEPLAGLLATGNCSGCRFGAQYTTSLPGQSISIAQTLGREAGRFAAHLS